MGNTVGSLEIPINLRARKNLLLALTGKQKESLIGCTLGDAYISPLGKIRIEQSIKQIDCLMWKYQELKSLAYPSLPRELIHKNIITGKKYKSIFFTMRQYFRSRRSIFYQGKNKVFPKKLLISPLSLAVWYMDDGCWTGKKCVISIESFDHENSQNVQNVFLKQFGIKTIIGKNRKLNHHIINFMI